MKLVVVGAKGMLGTDLLQAAAGFDVQGFDLPEIDIARRESVASVLPEADWVVNCAAYTRVDDAEKNRDAAFLVNATGAGHLASVCAERRTPLLHISTDYVFDGAATRPYVEEDATNPLGVYGASKLAGEQAVIAAGGPHLILRAQSLFGRNGQSFIRTIVRLLREGRTPLRVVKDQVSSPTYTLHLADAILRLIRAGKNGIVHVASSGQCSWFEFACAIARRVKPGAEVVPITAAEFRAPARRPGYSVLNTGRYRQWTGHTMPSWEEGMAAYLEAEGC